MKCPHCKFEWDRSIQEHNTLFGVIAYAFDQWRELHDFQPVDPEHLRAWLAIEVGHFECMDVDPALAADPAKLDVVATFCAGGKRHYRMGMRGHQLVLLRPLSMKKTELPVDQYRTMAAAIYELIESVTGVTVDAYKAELQRRHANGHRRKGRPHGDLRSVRAPA